MEVFSFLNGGKQDIWGWSTDQHFFFTMSLLCVRVPAALLHPADQNSEARQLPRGQAGGGGVPQLQAVALSSLPQGRTGRLGEETYRAGPVCAHHLSQCWCFLWQKMCRTSLCESVSAEELFPFGWSRTGLCQWEERGCQTRGINIPPPFSSLTLLLSASTTHPLKDDYSVTYATFYTGQM